MCVSGGLCSVRDYKKSVQPLSTGQTVTVGVEYICVLCTHNRNSAYNTYDQNSYFGMSVDFVVVGT